ncbi:UbiA family prenyltransferase [Actinoplanes sp. NPDC049802]|uniref:UbiA family prenyltransferase n=1 Tax=Actinoplanes sp. NPDC049802 TaxID=3154742 RepID=UPI0033C650B0
MDTYLTPSTPRPHVIPRLGLIARLCVIDARPTVLLVFLLRFLVGSAFAGADLTRDAVVRIGATALVWELAVFAVYLFNGVTDVHEDRINGSRRPIARGDLSTTAAGRVVVGASVLAVGGALLLGDAVLWPVLALLALGYCYSSPRVQLKRHATTSVLTGITLGLLTYFAGHIAHTGGWSWPSPALVVFVVAASAWMGIVGGVTKDLSDVPGDVAAGRHTIAGAWGERRARYTAAVSAMVLASAFVTSAALTSPLLLWPGISMLIGAIAMTVACLGGIAGATRKDSRAPYRVFMTTQYFLNISAIPPILSG